MFKRAIGILFVTHTLAFAIFLFHPAASAQEQAADLFLPIPAARVADAAPEQTQRLRQIRQRQTTASVDMVNVNIDALRAESTRMLLPGVGPLVMKYRKLEDRSADGFAWSGSLPGGFGGGTLVVRDGNITGSIRTDDGSLYRVEPIGQGAHALSKVDQSKFPRDHPPPFKAPEPRSDATPELPLSSAQPQGMPVGIDVLVAYTPEAAREASDIIGIIQLAVAETNQSYENSGIRIRLTLVDRFEFAYSESGRPMEAILNDFAADQAVNARRDSSGADAAVLLIGESYACGVTRGVRAGAANAFAIVRVGCATGYYSFAHELGHMLGARHDPGNDPLDTPFPYGHGFRHDEFPAWRTIMAYDCPTGCVRLQYWSNPRLALLGVPMGTADTSDNARVLNQNAAFVAGFRTRPVPMPGALEP